MHIYIDIVDACNCRCKGCPTTYFGKNTPGRMQPELYSKILHKAIAEYGPECVAFYNWTEPLLHPELHSFVASTKKARTSIVTAVSSNLSIVNIDPLLKAIGGGLDLLIVSVSGYSQETHSRYHVHGDIQRVRDNLETVSAYVKRNSYRTKIEVHYLQFGDNKSDERMMERYCQRIGVTFEPKMASYAKGVDDPDNMNRLICRPDVRAQGICLDLNDRLKGSYIAGSSPCMQIFDTLAIDHRGDAFLCCNRFYFEEYRVGHFLDLSPEELLYYRIIHPECYHCGGQRRPATAEDFARVQKSLYLVSRRDSAWIERMTINGVFYYPEYRRQQ